MSENTTSVRGKNWFSALTDKSTSVSGFVNSVVVADTTINSIHARVICVVPDANNKFHRARNGEVGLLEAWNVAKAVNEVVVADANKKEKRTIVALVDVTSQAYGRTEEAYAIHLALAAAGSAYVKARFSGHPIVTLIVGKAMSGGFLAHGYQANRIIALNDKEIIVHAMNKAAAARITMRKVEELEKLAEKNPPMAYDIKSFQSLGLIHQLIDVSNPNEPSKQDVDLAKKAIENTVADIRNSPADLRHRLLAENRKYSTLVRTMLKEQWN